MLRIVSWTQVSGGREVVGSGGVQGGVGSPRPASSRSVEPKQHGPLVLWRALALWNSLCTLLEGFALGLFTEAFKTCFLTVPSLSYLVPQFSTSCRAHKIQQSDNPSI